MPDGSVGHSKPEALHDVAVAEVEAWLRKMCDGARRLEVAELRAYASRTPAAGWRIPVSAAAGGIELDVIVSKDFPWSPPRVAFVGEDRLGKWPHAEADNVLCIADEAAFNPLDAAGAVATVLNDAVALVHASIAQVNRDDFLVEFESYWTHLTKTPAPPIYLLMRPEGATRIVRLWRDATHTVVADDDETLECWVRNIGYLEKRVHFGSSKALAVTVALPPMPEDYPKNGADIVNYLRGQAPEAVPMLASLADPALAAIDIILMAATPEGAPVAVAMGLLRPNPQYRGPARSPCDPMTRGFRNRLPASTALARYAGGIYRTAEVDRADHNWIHGRDVSADARQLAAASVIVLGAGSLGAPAAWSLARSGVGQVSIVDSKALKFGVLGRHTLGARSVRKNKALELVADMKRALPHLKGEGYPMTFQKFRDDHHDILSKASLIISAMGDWPAEGALNAWRIAQMHKPPIVFGWAEEHACAGHAVAIINNNACLACGMKPNGEQRLRVTRWPGPTLVNVPGCGAHFQPYGQIEISRIALMVSELAIAVLLGKATTPIHRIWVASEEMLKNVGGEWTPEWLAARGGREAGGSLVSRPWGFGACWMCGR